MFIEQRTAETDTLIGIAQNSCDNGYAPGDYPPIIVEIDDSGKIIDIVDGYHRAFGLPPGERVKVVACRADTDADADLICAAANAGEEQEEALEQLYAMAGLQ